MRPTRRVVQLVIPGTPSRQPFTDRALTHARGVTSRGPRPAAARDQPSSSTRRHINTRVYGVSRALLWDFIRILLRSKAYAPPIIQEIRMNNVLRNYS